MKYAGQGELFQGLEIWNDEAYKKLQGIYPVINVSFTKVKSANLSDTKEQIRGILKRVFKDYLFLRECNQLTADDKEYFNRILSDTASEVDIAESLNQLSDFLYRYYNQKVIILLDEYELSSQKQGVKNWYDGFLFGNVS